MSALDSLKRAPRWTWYVVGGVGVGAAAIKVWKGRDAAPTSSTASDGSTAADAYPGTGMPTTTGGSPPGVIVPPIITGGDGGSVGDLGSAFAGLVGGTITDLTGLVGMSIDANSATTQTWIGALSQNNSQFIDALANAGGPPQPVAVTPTPVNITVAAPPAATIATPPTVTTPTVPACPSSHPHRSSKGCYRCEKKDGKYVHIYNNGTPTSAGNDSC